jgi:hypothetical protein
VQDECFVSKALLNVLPHNHLVVHLGFGPKSLGEDIDVLVDIVAVLLLDELITVL